MDYSDSTEQAAEYVRMALPLMARHGVPPHPVNFSVWYEYVSGRNSELKQSLDRLLEDGHPFSPEIQKSLFRRFLAEGDEAAIEEMRMGIRRMLTEALSQLIESNGQAMHYGRVLETYSGHLAKPVDLDEMRRIVNMLLTETKTMEYANTLLEEKLKSTSRELDTLRKELERSKQEANTDTLTGLANRKAFNQELGERIVLPESVGTVSLLIADIDHFKHFNDSYGHLLGDKLLRFVSNSLKQCVRGQDLVARYGGEEFAIVLPDTALKGALAVAENIRGAIETQRLRKRDSHESISAVTVSIGVACLRPEETMDSFIQRADMALYRAKQTGRNRVVSEASLNN
jgi:diguanylate cyclase